ncbi:MAG: SDR family NAD(P)-dependent oxidoreductase [Pirellulales bacterium]|nr:SDR family NAD(P)-dependent oxidoreductase [Pirellulales bacterium]
MIRRKLKNLRALVTGVSSGIGRAVADLLVGQGVHVLGMARRGELLAEWQKTWENPQDPRNHPGQTAIFVGDITRPEDRTAALRMVESRFHGLDLLINNAGTGSLGRFAQSDPRLLRTIFEVNFFAPVELCRAALPLLQNGQTPLIVNLGSILGHRATPQNSEYCASKFALRGWSESVRPELNKIGIDLLLVSPGTTETDFYAHTLGDDHTPPWPSPPGVPAERVARAIVRAIETGRGEIVPNWRGRALVWANRLCPWLVDRAMRKYG